MFGRSRQPSISDNDLMFFAQYSCVAFVFFVRGIKNYVPFKICDYLILNSIQSYQYDDFSSIFAKVYKNTENVFITNNNSTDEWKYQVVSEKNCAIKWKTIKYFGNC